jgi:hypothetical protein
MINWRSPPFSPIAGHYSLSRNHLRLTPLNSRKPQLTATPSTAVTHPLSALNAPLCTPGTVHTMVAVREQVKRWVQHVSINVVKSAWAGDVRWLCSRGRWTGTPPHPPPPGSQAACPSCRFPLRAGSNTRHSTPLHGVHSTTKGHLGVYLLRVGLLWGACV